MAAGEAMTARRAWQRMPAPGVREALRIAALVAITVAAYARLSTNGFINLDDQDFLLSNKLVTGGLSREGVRWAFTSTWANNWHPLTWLSHMLDFELFGMDAGGHHLTGLAFHVAAAIAFYLLLRAATDSPGRSLLASALFAVHPFQVESVAWASQLKTPLSGLFYFLAALAWVSYARRPGAARYALVLALGALSFMAKPSAVTLPISLLILDAWPLGRLTRPAGEPLRGGLRRCLAEQIPFLAAALAGSLLTVRVQVEAMKAAASLPLPARLANAIVAYGDYVGKFFWPRDFAVFYPHQGMPPAIRILGAAAFLGAVTWLAARAWRRRPYLLAGWLWFLGTMLPTIGLIQVGIQAMADRYMYLPIAGLAIAAAWGAADLWTATGRGRLPAAALAACAVLSLSAMTWRQAGLWHTSRALFMAQYVHEIRNHPRDDAKRVEYGQELVKDGRLEEGRAQYFTALAINPRNGLAHVGLAEALASEGKRDEAIQEYDRGIQMAPGNIEVREKLGDFLLEAGRPAEAIEHLEAVARARPRDVETRVRIGVAYMSIQRPLEAAAAYQDALKIAPRHAYAHYNLAEIYVMANDLEKAELHYRKALEARPDFMPAHFNLGVVLGREGKTREAIAQLRRAIALDGGLAPAHARLADLLAKEGETDEALVHYRQALRLNPGDAKADEGMRRLLERKP